MKTNVLNSIPKKMLALYAERYVRSRASWWPLFLFHRLSCYNVRTDRSTLFYLPRGFFIQLFFSPERVTTSKIKKTYILDRLSRSKITVVFI